MSVGLDPFFAYCRARGLTVGSILPSGRIGYGPSDMKWGAPRKRIEESLEYKGFVDALVGRRRNVDSRGPLGKVLDRLFGVHPNRRGLWGKDSRTDDESYLYGQRLAGVALRNIESYVVNLN